MVRQRLQSSFAFRRSSCNLGEAGLTFGIFNKQTEYNIKKSDSGSSCNMADVGTGQLKRMKTLYIFSVSQKKPTDIGKTKK